MKLYLIGFQRSGTTLLRRLISLHPQVVSVLHEARILTYGQNEKDVRRRALEAAQKDLGEGILTDLDSQNWGTKVPYVNEPEKVLERCKRWIAMWPDAYVLNIVRDPVDTALSNFKTFQMPHETFVLAYQLCMKTLLPDLSTLPPVHFRHVRFEALVRRPVKVLSNLFGWFGINPSFTQRIVESARKKELRYFDGISKDRAFAWHRDGSEGMAQYLSALKGIARLLDRYAPPGKVCEGYENSLKIGSKKNVKK